MMATTISINKVLARGGKIYLQFNDDITMEFTSAAHVKAWAFSLDDQERDLLRKLIARWWFARDANGASPSTVEGKQMTFDLASLTPLVVI